MRIAIVANEGGRVYRSRRALLRVLRGLGAEVLVIGPDAAVSATPEFRDIPGLDWKLSRQGLNPVAELQSIHALARIYRHAKPTVVHHFRMKPNVYGALAARIAGVPVSIATVTGLGFLFTEDGSEVALPTTMARAMVRRTIAISDLVIFQNPSDQSAVPVRRSRVVPGSGVDIHHFAPGAAPTEDVARIRESLSIGPGDPVVVMAGRLLRHKGVAEYSEAARLVRTKIPSARFLFAGPVDTGNPAAIDEAQARALFGSHVTWLGPMTDIRPLLEVAQVVVLPSYREGFPRVILEAMAMERACVTTDVPGCRDAVDPGKTGLLVPARSGEALAAAVVRLLEDSDLRASMQSQARKKVEAEFGDVPVIQGFLEAYHGLFLEKGITPPWTRPSNRQVAELLRAPDPTAPKAAPEVRE